MPFPTAKKFIDSGEPKNKGGAPSLLESVEPDALLRQYARIMREDKQNGAPKSMRRLLSEDPKAFYDDLLALVRLKAEGQKSSQPMLRINLTLPAKIPVGKPVGYRPQKYEEIKIESQKLLPEGRVGDEAVEADGVAEQSPPEERV
jgi:hypothetical protein